MFTYSSQSEYRCADRFTFLHKLPYSTAAFYNLLLAIHDNLVCYTDTKPTNMGIQSPGHVCTMLNLNCKSKETGMCSVFTL